MKKIVLATKNKNKVNELRSMLIEQDIDVVSQYDYSVPDIDETGLTFVENALIKARHTTTFTGMPTIADDSGLVVEKLNGAPGIYSSRYAGQPTNDKKNNEKLLSALINTPTSQRKAYFYCILVYLRHRTDPAPIICRGKWWGYILTKPQGQNGFGYDPLFYIAALNRTAAELDYKQKNIFSHRGQALRSMIKALQDDD